MRKFNNSKTLRNYSMYFNASIEYITPTSRSKPPSETPMSDIFLVIYFNEAPTYKLVVDCHNGIPADK